VPTDGHPNGLIIPQGGEEGNAGAGVAELDWANFDEGKPERKRGRFNSERRGKKLLDLRPCTVHSVAMKGVDCLMNRKTRNDRQAVAPISSPGRTMCLTCGGPITETARTDPSCRIALTTWWMYFGPIFCSPGCRTQAERGLLSSATFQANPDRLWQSLLLGKRREKAKENNS
jgi:hypothetical protein